MKTYKIIFISIFSLTTFLTFAQSQGVYSNETDFREGKLTYAINCSTKKHKIKLNEFLYKPYITVIHDKESYNLQKNEIFAYKDCGDVTYRFVGKSRYVILNPVEEIILYKHETPPSKNKKAVINYFFSVSGAGEVQKLTLTNLKKAFPDNYKFHDLLDAQFNSEVELIRYDSYYKTYKVNRLYSNSL